MKENYLKVVLLLLIAVVTIQGYFLYDVNRTMNERRVSVFPFIEIDRMHREMESRFMDFEDFFQTVPTLKKFYSKLYRTPSFDMKEQDGKYIVTIEVPGLDKDAINIKTEQGQLIVTAKVSKEKENNTTTYYQRERRMSSYRHVLSLPTDANEKSLHSEYKDGLLTITFEKTIP